MATRKVYTAELERLSTKVADMGNQLERMIIQVMQALETLDADMAKDIIGQDDIIDDLEREIERSCINIVAKQAPVATDLRRVTSIMRLISDIERIADHCGDVSEYIIDLSKEEAVSLPEGLKDMFTQMRRMAKKTIAAFVDEEVQEIEKIIKEDDVIDEYFEKIKEDLCESMQRHPKRIRQYVDYLLITKYVERMADHCTNIAEWVDFIVTGELEEYMNYSESLPQTGA